MFKNYILALCLLIPITANANIDFFTKHIKVEDEHKDKRTVKAYIYKYNRAHFANTDNIPESQSQHTSTSASWPFAPDPSGLYYIQVTCMTSLAYDQSYPFETQKKLNNGDQVYITVKCNLDHAENPMTPEVKININPE